MSKKPLGKIFMNGIIDENPTFRLLLGMCPTLAISTAATNGLGMGLAATFVLVFSNLVISLLRKVIPEKVRIPSFVVVIASFVTMIDLLLKAFIPSLSESLGVYIPLIVVNCIIFARAEAFAFKNGPIESIFDGLGMGLGFTIALTILSAIRECIGAGTIFGMQVMPANYQPMAIAVMPTGGFIFLGLLLLIVNGLMSYIDKRKKEKEEEEMML